MAVVSFGGDRHERLEIEVLGYEREQTGEYYDDNWLNVRVTVAAGGFRGCFDATFQAAELDSFFGELRVLYERLDGHARFNTMEEQLAVDIEGNGRGAMTLHGIATDQPGIGNKFEFSLALDQSQISAALAQLRHVMREFPVRAA